MAFKVGDRVMYVPNGSAYPKVECEITEVIPPLPHRELSTYCLKQIMHHRVFSAGTRYVCVAVYKIRHTTTLGQIRELVSEWLA